MNSLRDAIFTYEVITKDTTTFSTSQKIAKLDKEVTSRLVQDARGSSSDSSGHVLESIETPAEISSREWGPAESPLLQPVRVNLSPS